MESSCAYIKVATQSLLVNHCVWEMHQSCLIAQISPPYPLPTKGKEGRLARGRIELLAIFYCTVVAKKEGIPEKIRVVTPKTLEGTILLLSDLFSDMQLIGVGALCCKNDFKHFMLSYSLDAFIVVLQ